MERKKAEAKMQGFKDSLENSSNAVGMSTPEGRHYYQNKAFLDLFGEIGEYSQGSLCVDKKIKDEIFKVIMNGDRWKGELKMYSKTGEILDILLSAYANKDINGNITSMVGVHTNITEHKKALEKINQQYAEKEILLKEVHHRIKNNISSIGSMLILQAESADNPDVKNILNDAIRRVENMRLIYDKLLLTDDYTDISVKFYITDLISAIQGLYPEKNGIKVEHEIQDFSLNVDLMFPLGTIINELITNSFKYGYKKNKEGIIKIRLYKKENTVTLTVHDNGAGLPEGFDPDQSGGLGLMLVKMLAQQLNGNFSMKTNNGTECRVEFTLREKYII